MEKSKTSTDETPVINNDDEEVISRDEEEQGTRSKTSQKGDNSIYNIVRKFFKRGTFGRDNSSKAQLIEKVSKEKCKNRKETESQEISNKNGEKETNGKKWRNGSKENGRSQSKDLNKRNGRAFKEDGEKQTKCRKASRNDQGEECRHRACQSAKQFKSGDHAAFEEETENDSLSNFTNSTEESFETIDDHTYENLRFPPDIKEGDSSSKYPPKKHFFKRVYKNIQPEAETEEIRERLINEREQEVFFRRPRGGIQRSFSNDVEGLNFGNVNPPGSKIMKFIQENVRKLSLPSMQSGGLILLNRDGRNVQFSELKPDLDPILVSTETSKRLSNPYLMSGGNVILEGFSDGFKLPNFYAKDPIVFDQLPDELQLPQTSAIDVPKVERPLVARSCSGGRVFEDTSNGPYLPELFPYKTSPPKAESSNFSYRRSLSGGGLIEPDEVQNEIFLDLLSQSIKLEEEEKNAAKPFVKHNMEGLKV